MTRRDHRLRRLVGLAAVAIAPALLGACGSEQPARLSGAVLDPLPVVAGITLPDATDGLAPFELRAEPGGLLVVYFGYTNCPDFCPTTMSDAKLARSRLDDPAKVSIAMVTVDPERDFVVDPDLCEDEIVLSCYVRSFVDDAHALGTDDPAALAEAAAPFGAVYNVIRSGDEVIVEHSTYLYAVDDQGRIAVAWQFGIPIDDLVADMQLLLDRAASGSA